MMKLENMDTFKVKKFTKELADIIEYINNNLLQEYPSEKVTPEYFILAVLNNESCYAYNTISQVMLTETIEVLRTWCYKHLAASSNKISDNDNPIKFDNTMLNVFTISVANSNDTVNSNDILYHLLDENEEVKKTFKLLGVTEEEVLRCSDAGGVVSLDTPVDREGDSMSLHDILPADSDVFEDIEDRDALDSALRTLEPEERSLVHYRFVQELSQMETAKKMGISQMNVSRMERRILQKLREILKKSMVG